MPKVKKKKKWKCLGKPLPHQKECYRLINKFGGNALIADDMGLGKTFESLLWCVQQGHYPVVIICKATLRYNWQHEIMHHFGMSSVVLESRKVDPSLIKDAKFIILNFAILGAWLDALCELQPMVLILDECQGISNRSTKQYKHVYDLRWACEYFLALSGTPLMNRPVELWPVLNLLCPEVWPSFTRFAVKHCQPSFERGRIVYKGATHIPLLHKKMLKHCMIRRLRKDVLDLPPKTREIISLPITNRKEYEYASNNFLVWLEKRHGKRARAAATKSQMLTRSGYMRRLLIEGKIKAVIEWVSNFLEETDEKLVLLGCHVEYIDLIFKKFEKVAVKVDGTVNQKQRNAAVFAFQNDLRKRLFVGSLLVAGEGYTLTSACHLACFELDYVPARHQQGEARTLRLTQNRPCYFYYLIAENTIEEKVATILDEKCDVLSGVLDGGKGEVLDLLELYNEMKEEKRIERMKRKKRFK